MSKLENTIIQIAREHLMELRSTATEPESIERNCTLSNVNAMLDGLLMLGHMDSGLSADSVQQLLSIESQSGELMSSLPPRTASQSLAYVRADGSRGSADLHSTKSVLITGSSEPVSTLTEILRLNGRPVHTLTEEECQTVMFHHRTGRKTGVHVLLQAGNEVQEIQSEPGFMASMAHTDAVVSVILKP